MFTSLSNLRLFPKSKLWHPTWVTAYSEAKALFKTGDVILADGDYKGAKLLDFIQQNHWGHAALIIRKEDIEPHSEVDMTKWPDLLLWESNAFIEDSTKNLWGPEEFQVVKEGPMLISLEERLQHTANNFDKVAIAYRPMYLKDNLRKRLDFSLLPAHFDQFIDRKFPSNKEIIHDVFIGRRYNKTKNYEDGDLNLTIFLKRFVLETDFKKKRKLKTFSPDDVPEKDRIYCTELMAHTYKLLSLLTNNHVSNCYTPKDFSADGEIRLLQDAWLGDEILLDMNK